MAVIVIWGACSIEKWPPGTLSTFRKRSETKSSASSDIQRHVIHEFM